MRILRNQNFLLISGISYLVSSYSFQSILLKVRMSKHDYETSATLKNESKVFTGVF